MSFRKEALPTTESPSESPAQRPGWVERFKTFRDSHSLKPLLCLMIYLAIPLMAFQLILIQYPSLDPVRFRSATVLIVPIALLILGVALVQEKHPKGEPSRLCLDAVYVFLTLLWLLSLIGGSTVIRSSYEGHPFAVDITPLVVLAVITAAANFAHDIFEYRYYRAGADRPVQAIGGEHAIAPAVLSFQRDNSPFYFDIMGTRGDDDECSVVSYSILLGAPMSPPEAPPDARQARPKPDKGC